MSVINVDGLRVSNSSFRNTNGTPPQSGIDIEPDKPSQLLKRIELRDIILENNLGCGLEIEFGSYIGSPVKRNPLSATYFFRWAAFLLDGRVRCTFRSPWGSSRRMCGAATTPSASAC